MYLAQGHNERTCRRDFHTTLLILTVKHGKRYDLATPVSQAFPLIHHYTKILLNHLYSMKG